jgi:hypothetical protein
MEAMNGLLTTSFRATSDAFDVYCDRLTMALRDVKLRLQAQYERECPGEAVRIREAIRLAEIAAWQTEFPHLFLPDLVEEAIARLSFSSKSEQKEHESITMEHMA